MPLSGTEFVWDHRKNKVCQDKQALRAGCRPSVYQTHQTLSKLHRVSALAGSLILQLLSLFFSIKESFRPWVVFLSHGVERKSFCQLRCIMHIRAGWLVV